MTTRSAVQTAIEEQQRACSKQFLDMFLECCSSHLVQGSRGFVMTMYSVGKSHPGRLKNPYIHDDHVCQRMLTKDHLLGIVSEVNEKGYPTVLESGGDSTTITTELTPPPAHIPKSDSGMNLPGMAYISIGGIIGAAIATVLVRKSK